MINPIVLALLGTLTVTSYRSIPQATDDSPYITATGEKVDKHGIAVSQDLLCPMAFGKTKLHSRKTCLYKESIHYGDWLVVEKYGPKQVNDCMHPRWKNRVDIWVSSYPEEKAIGVRKLKIWRLHTSI